MLGQDTGKSESQVGMWEFAQRQRPHLEIWEAGNLDVWEYGALGMWIHRFPKLQFVNINIRADQIVYKVQISKTNILTLLK